MQEQAIPTCTPIRRLAGWLVHLFTASTAVVGIFTLQAIYQQQFLLAFWLMWTAIGIDALDGTLARAIHIKVAVPKIDGALLDNILDYFNYVVTPSFMLLVTTMLPDSVRALMVSIIVLSSAYQFTQSDAKTDDHFFKGFPSYWNIAVFYLFLFHTAPWTNFIILSSLAVLIFVPIKYVYPSRLDYLFESRRLRVATLLATLLYGAATAGILWMYPEKNTLLLSYSILYGLFYIGVSLYRTLVPLTLKITRKRRDRG